MKTFKDLSFERKCAILDAVREVQSQHNDIEYVLYKRALSRRAYIKKTKTITKKNK